MPRPRSGASKKEKRTKKPTLQQCCDKVWHHLEEVYEWQQKVYDFFWGPGGGGGTPPPPPPKWP